MKKNLCGWNLLLSNYLASINLGQGFPGWEPEQMVIESLRSVCEKTGISQYSSPKGEQILRDQIATSYKKNQLETSVPIRKFWLRLEPLKGSI